VIGHSAAEFETAFIDHKSKLKMDFTMIGINERRQKNKRRKEKIEYHQSELNKRNDWNERRKGLESKET
jgi:hypothetical protein